MILQIYNNNEIDPRNPVWEIGPWDFIVKRMTLLDDMHYVAAKVEPENHITKSAMCQLTT